MKIKIVGLVVFFFVTFGVAEESYCTSIDDDKGTNLNQSVCYLKCLSDALNKLYTDGERKLFLNEEVYANASRMLDDMEGKTGESVIYLSVISSVMVEENDKLENLISYGNAMGDLVAKAGGLFAEVNESVRAVRNAIPGALITSNKYYTAIAEIARTVWDDVKAVSNDEGPECKKGALKGVRGFPVVCVDQTCPLLTGVNEITLQKYRGGCLQIDVLTGSGSVSKCLNLPRDNLYKGGAVKNSTGLINWRENGPAFFQLQIYVEEIFDPLIEPFTSGKAPPELLDMMANITLLQSYFNDIHRNFTSLQFSTNNIDNMKSTNFTI
ncbi:expression site-associated gene (ESAG) protein, putative [Trypanosoma brucei brucei TREU927]|uniref:Expression site-associated gene (ESAG) protein, putative n=1 Tax=Trypanosoma brucei brucei (strain 927/4 GUTat10.1) TaxID=185431 RepID=Q582W5_TRYB2|nr:expression site-associated gene (ESAG) protein, putative [Trypanosoma brucei brucei TREU927]AAX80724.1 expression site-associated gene (ESAG) protein, putative [Trypanosoma brucei]AAZ10287.1 expression site-associated gene (ESAG) protein, putative [Trypanosoma brucei brucei TREU927]